MFCYSGNVLSVEGDAVVVVEPEFELDGINSGSWYHCLPLTVKGRLYSSCAQSIMLHGSETWPIRKENKMVHQLAEMRMVRWMCGVKLQDRVQSKGFRERLGLDDIISVLQQNRW